MLETKMEILGSFLTKETAYQKILDQLLVYLKKQQVFQSKQFGEFLPQELLQAYNTSFLVPILKIEEMQVYKVEVEKAAKELRNIYLRSKLKSLGIRIKDQEKTKGKNLDSLHQK